MVLVEGAALLRDRFEGSPRADSARPCTEWQWATATTSGRAAWTWECTVKAAWLTWWPPSTTCPSELTSTRSLTVMCAKGTPKGLTQKQSVYWGSRTVM